MQNKDKGDGIEDSPLYMLLVILLDGASKEVVMPSSQQTLPIASKRLIHSLLNPNWQESEKNCTTFLLNIVKVCQQQHHQIF